MKIEQPRIAAPLNEGKLCELEPDSMVENQQFGNETIDSIELDQIYFKGCQFNATVFNQVKFNRFEMMDCKFEHCAFLNCQMEGVIGKRLIFDGCKLTGTDLPESSLIDVWLNDCDGMYSGWGGAQMQHVRFENTRLTQASFVETTFKNSEFINCEMTETDFLGTSLKGVDLSTCQLIDTRFEIEHLRGATVPVNYAVDIVAQLGIKVK